MDERPTSDELVRPWRRRSESPVEAATWTLGSSIGTKALSLATHIVLGLLLTPRDYGLYATALGLSVVGVVLRDAGVPSVLIQRGRFAEDWSAARRLSLSANLVAGLLVLAVAAWSGNSDELRVMLVLAAVSIPASTWASLYRARARSQLQMRGLSSIGVISVAFQTILTVTLALFGFGALSFAIPFVVVPVLETVLLRRLAGNGTNFVHADVKTTSIAELFRSSRWMMLTAAALMLVQRGDYLVLGLMVSPAILGVYFFAFQMTLAMNTLVAISVNTTLLPYLSRRASEDRGANSLYYNGTRLLGLAGGLLFGGLIASAPILVPLIWGDRWLEAIVPIQLFAGAAAVRLINAVTQTLLEALGAWPQRAAITWVEGLGLVIAAGLGAVLGGLETIVWAVVAVRTGQGLLTLYWGDRRLHSSLLDGGVVHFLLPIVGSISAGLLIAPNGPLRLVPSEPALGSLVLVGAGYIALWLIMLFCTVAIVPAYAASIRKLLGGLRAMRDH